MPQRIQVRADGTLDQPIDYSTCCYLGDFFAPGLPEHLVRLCAAQAGGTRYFSAPSRPGHICVWGPRRDEEYLSSACLRRRAAGLGLPPELANAYKPDGAISVLPGSDDGQNWGNSVFSGSFPAGQRTYGKL